MNNKCIYYCYATQAGKTTSACMKIHRQLLCSKQKLIIYKSFPWLGQKYFLECLLLIIPSILQRRIVVFPLGMLRTSSLFLVPATGNYFLLLLFCNLVKKCFYSFTNSFSKQWPARTLWGSDFCSTLSASPELFCCTSKCSVFLRRIESK